MSSAPSGLDGDDAETSFRLVVEAAPNAIFVVGGDDRIAFANPAAEILFGYGRDELIGQPVGPLISGRRKDGTEIPIEIRRQSIPSPTAPFTVAFITDITELKRAEERFRLVVEAAPNALLVADRNQTITLVNRMTEDMFGYSRAELMGMPIESLVSERARARHGAHVAGYFADPKARPMGAGRVLFGRRKDGVEIPVEIGLNPIDTPDGPQTLASIIDITDRKRDEDELRRSNADLEQFALLASHDMQEPLRVIASFTELLAMRYQGKLDDKADKYLFHAVDGAKRLQRLVADLLTYARVGSRGKRLAPLSAQAVVKKVVALLADSLKSTKAKVEVSALPVVLADEGELHRLFQNLIENAVKFRGDEAPRIEIKAERDGERWRFSVTDNGIGIDMQYADRIFEMFERLHERGKYEGSGIGLSIAKRIVERHRGRISVESHPGGGTTFFFTLLAPTPKSSR